MKDKNQKEQSAEAEVAAAESAAEEVREVRHTISSEETFTLAKDVYDLRCAIRKIYSNRTKIARRLNLLSLVFSLIYTAIYVALILYLGVAGTLSQGWEIASYVILGAYAALICALAVCAAVTQKGTVKNYKRNGKVLKTFRYLVRVASLAMSIAALAISFSDGAENILNLGLRTVALVISVISIILALVPLIFGGIGGVARWVMAPSGKNKRFSSVVLEWYGNATSPSANFIATKKIEKSRLEDIGRCVDGYILPALGKRKVGAIGANQIYAAIEITPQDDRATVEGILKNVFDYAVECGYVAENPCRDLKLRGTIEVAEKPKKEPLKVRIGKKIGASIIKQFLGESNDDD